MRIQTKPRPLPADAQPLPADLTLIRQPGQRTGLGLSILAGVLMPVIPIVLLIIQSMARPSAAGSEETIPPWIILPVLLVSVVAHEVLHLIWHPGWGLSAQSVVILRPGRLQFGVYYDGFMKRSRWLVMRLSPLVGLTLLPTLVLLVTYPAWPSFFWKQFAELVVLVNGLGAGSDLVASIIVARQVPAQGEIGLWNGRAYWRPPPAEVRGRGTERGTR